MLASVRILRERGAAWVYLVYSAPSTVSHEEVSVVTISKLKQIYVVKFKQTQV